MLPRQILRPFWRSRYAAPVAIVLALVGLTVNEVGYQAVRHFDEQFAESLQARTLAGRLRRNLLTAESSQRGYLLTGRAEYREPYDRSARELRALLGEVAAAFPQGHRLAAEAEALVELARQRQSEIDEVLQLFQAGSREKAQTVLMTDIGRERMEAIERAIDRLVNAEMAASRALQQRIERVLFWNRWMLALLILLSLGAMLMYIRELRGRERERREQEEMLRAERDRLEATVERRTAQLTRIAEHLQQVRESERGHLARELHDELGGLLTAAKLDLARAKNRLAEAPPEVTERLRHLGALLDSVIALKRRIIEDLRPSALSNLGLPAALRALCEEFAQRSEIAVDVRVDEITLSPDRALTAYRLVQEALTNVARHAKARQVVVRIEADGDQARVHVSDDGVGFDASERPTASHGLEGMGFRARSAGGRLSIRSTPGQGTTIEALLPIA